MKKLLLLVILCGLVSFGFYFELDRFLTLTYIQQNLSWFQGLAQSHRVEFVSVFMAVYITSTALSFPGATVLTLLAGAIFGLGWGLLLVSFASTIGATFAFLAARYLFRDFVVKRFEPQMQTINRGIEREGAFYLFTLRLLPIFPFFLINLVLGLTKMKTITYYFVSQVGMLLGTIVYVNAGVQLADIKSMSDILSAELLASFAALGLLPLIGKKMISRLHALRVYRPFAKARPKKYDFDLIAIGGGAAGLVSAYIGAAVKAKVALVEKENMGGDCLNTGCVPSKALIRAAHSVHEFKKAEKLGISDIQYRVDFPKVMQRVHAVIKKIEPHDSVERYEGLGVNCLQGHAKIIDPWHVEVDGKSYSTRQIVIAAGASPFVPPIKGLDRVEYLTSESLWDLDDLPKRLLVLGGGPIGCELAQSFARLGSQVSLVEMLPRLMAVEDEEVSEFVLQQFQSEGIDIYLQHKAMEVIPSGELHTLVCDVNGQQKNIEFDKILIAVGRKPRTEGYGLEDLQIPLRGNGTIEVDEYLATKYPNIFACGDVTGPFQFTHTAAHQAWFCAVNGLFGAFKKFKVDYSVIPWCTYTDPEIATVGLTESMAKENGVDYRVYRYDLDDLDRAIADDNEQGFVKVLTKGNTDKIIGATIVGASASNLLIEFVAAMKHGFGLNKILGTIHVYPSMGEANKYVAGVWRKSTANSKVLGYLKAFFKWRRG